jgi:hypothetical protein
MCMCGVVRRLVLKYFRVWVINADTDGARAVLCAVH